jgi:RimJ/RimL family protein N-acetyltransferase
MVSLCPLDQRHLDRTRGWANDPELCELLDRALPVSDVEHQQWFANLHAQADRLYLAIEHLPERSHIGNAWLWNIDWRHRRAELRIVIGVEGSRGKGLGTEAVSLLSAYALSRLNLHKIYAYVLACNPRAVRSFEKAGFGVEAILKQDRWVGDRYDDVYLLARFQNPPFTPTASGGA